MRPRTWRARAVAPGHLVVALLAAGLLCAAPASACSGGRAPSSIEPLGGPRADRGTTARSDHPTTVVTDETTTRRDTDGPVTTAAVGSAGETIDEALRAEVDELLERFDRAVSDLAAQPLAAGDDSHPLSRAWLAVVDPGSPLDDEVRSRILTDGTDNGQRIVAGSDGTAFRNTALDVTRGVDGSVSWTNCGYAPGLAVDIRTGEIRDDRRASTRGHGTAVRTQQGELRLSRLVDEEIVHLAPGEPDPCAPRP